VKYLHGTPVALSWERDTTNNPVLAARMKWFSHRPDEELYDLQTDPYETNNLAADKSFAAIKTRLARELESWMAQQGDKGMETEMLAKTRQGAGRAAARKKAAEEMEEDL
jgi:N-sulfoglucosamine sulfohydrolase